MYCDPHLPSVLPALLPVADITRADAGQMPVLAACHFLGSDHVTLSELCLMGWLRAGLVVHQPLGSDLFGLSRPN